MVIAINSFIKPFLSISRLLSVQLTRCMAFTCAVIVSTHTGLNA